MKKFLAALFVLLVMANAPAFASNFGPATPAVEPGNFYFGVGAQRHNANWDTDEVADDKARQNRFFVQGGYVFGNALEGYLRAGGADLKYEDAFGGSDFENEDTAPYASVGIKGMLRRTQIFDVGFFLEGSFTGSFEDSETFGTSTVKVEFEESVEVNAGLILQKQIEGAFLYGGPVVFFHEGDITSTATTTTATITGSGSYEEEDNLGAFLGIRWPLKNGMTIDLEGQLKSDFSIGGNILFPF